MMRRTSSFVTSLVHKHSTVRPALYAAAPTSGSTSGHGVVLPIIPSRIPFSSTASAATSSSTPSTSDASAAAAFTASEAVSAPADIPQGWKGVARFYDSVGVAPADDGKEGFVVLIEGRQLKTNAMNDLLLPSEGLALGIAAEFAAQGSMIHPPSTPLYNLACLAIDTYAVDATVPKPFFQEENVTESEKLRDELSDFLDTDSVVYRVAINPHDAGEVILRRRQDKHYDPIVKWFEERFGGPLHVVDGLREAKHPKSVYPPLQQFVDSADPWMMAAVRQTLGTVKSTVIALAFLSRHLSVDQAMEVCRVEEEFQIEEHGFVEDGHDTSRANTRVKLASASSFLWLLPSSTSLAPFEAATAVSEAAMKKEGKAGK